MRFSRTLTLTLGPLVLVGVCYIVAAPSRPAANVAASVSCVQVEVSPEELTRRCHEAADALLRRVPSDWSFLVRPPFVLTGDLRPEPLESLFVETIAPTAHALQIDYFDDASIQPITLVILTSDDTYRSALKRFGHAGREEYSGLYARDERIAILNLATGDGTVAHEMTHALAHVDFPNMPEWFDEGLASLHEESEFTPDGSHLRGRDNWRLRYLQEAVQRDCWKPLDRLFDRPFADLDSAALDYALARYLCLYLQERGLLTAYYRKCRESQFRDDSGREALLRLFPGRSLAELDGEFRSWLSVRF